MSITAATSHAELTTIRPASGADLESVFALVEQLGIGESPRRDSFEIAFEGAIAGSSGHLLLVAERQGRVVGYALASIARPLYTNGESAQLQELVVDSASRGHRIGSQLVAAVEDACRARGVRQLTVASIRAAALFYEQLDYRSTSEFLKKSFVED